MHLIAQKIKQLSDFTVDFPFRCILFTASYFPLLLPFKLTYTHENSDDTDFIFYFIDEKLQ